ncbi:hypothetical protein WICMUC_001020 [Wickerhamomyces mucosus]|uniref:Uncharacterized protein n=1 Tax=Wickerhamomyces mucosus TaxID=1378264 RepID=A0A9P8TI17_9ASCO|nr:hypothetical protein WICMUC_001020 [Wickerhamomyces mucosus]
MSTHAPQFENPAIESVLSSIAPTVMASGALAGDTRQESMFALPAATTTTNPEETATDIAWFRILFLIAPNDKLTTPETLFSFL